MTVRPRGRFAQGRAEQSAPGGKWTAPGPRGRPHLDLHGLLRAQALELGLDPARDGSLALCTVCHPELLYSYRRGDQPPALRQWGWVRIG